MTSEEQIEKALLELVRARGRRSSVCPSEVARRLDPDDWRPLMEPVRRVAARLQRAGSVAVLQGDALAGPPPWRGPIRIAAVDQ